MKKFTVFVILLLSFLTVTGQPGPVIDDVTPQVELTLLWNWNRSTNIAQEASINFNTTHRNNTNNPHSVSLAQVGISTWTGSASLSTVGTLSTGIYQATPITDAYISNLISLYSITQIQNRSHTSLTDIGTNSHGSIDSHIVSNSNPHEVTALQILPSQTGNPYRPLVTNGTLADWRRRIAVDTITEATAGHGILADGVRLIDGGVIMTDGSRLYLDGGGDTYIYHPGSDTFRVVTNGKVTFDINDFEVVTYLDLVPGATNKIHLGSLDRYYQHAYINRVHIRESSNYLDVTGTGDDMEFTFTDPKNGTKTMSELLAGGGSTDTIHGPDVVKFLSDTTSFTFGFGMGAPTDTAGCFDGAILGILPNQQNISVALVINDAIALGTGASVPVRIVYDMNPFDATPTVIWAGTITTSPTNSTTFTTKNIPPNTHIWAEINGDPSVKATLIYLPFEFAKTVQ